MLLRFIARLRPIRIPRGLVLDAHFSESQFLYWDNKTIKVLCEKELRKEK